MSRYVSSERLTRPARGSAVDPAGPIAAVIDCDIAAGINRIHTHARQAFVLVRVFTEPIGILILSTPGGSLCAEDVARSIADRFEAELQPRLSASGIEWTGHLPIDGLRPARPPAFLESRARVLRDGPPITVAVCTRDRPESLALLLDSLITQEYRRLRILVVDNAPSDGRTRQLVAAFGDDHDLTYVVEDRPGLSWARNRAIEHCEDGIIAWADDDEICDRWWATELARGFVDVPNADVVTGLVIPSELATPSQGWYEEYAGVRRGRGFNRLVFSPDTAHRANPLFPAPPFGIGANMAFRRSSLLQIGCFDRALGAGSPTLAGEDTAALSTLLLSGGTIVYQPTAIVHHRHRREYTALKRLLLAHGRGLTAFYTAMIVRQPGHALEVARLAGRALGHQIRRRGHSPAQLSPEFPPDLLWANRIGLLQGPFMYAVARLRVRRLASQSPSERPD